MTKSNEEKTNKRIKTWKRTNVKVTPEMAKELKALQCQQTLQAIENIKQGTIQEWIESLKSVGVKTRQDVRIIIDWYKPRLINLGLVEQV